MGRTLGKSSTMFVYLDMIKAASHLDEILTPVADKKRNQIKSNKSATKAERKALNHKQRQIDHRNKLLGKY